MKKNRMRILSAMLCAAMLCGLMPVAAAAETVTTKEAVRFVEEVSEGVFSYEDKVVTTTRELPEEQSAELVTIVQQHQSDASALSVTQNEYDGYSFTTFEDLKELAAGSYEEYTRIYYESAEPLVISEDLALPEELRVMMQDARITVSAGITFQAGSLSAGVLVVEGTAHIGSLQVQSELTVTGTLNCGDTILLGLDTAVTGGENVVFANSWSGFWVDCQIGDEAGLRRAVAAAAGDQNSRKTYALVISDNVVLTEDVTIPANCELNVMAPLTVSSGCTLTLNGYTYVQDQLTVEGTLHNEKHMNIHISEYDNGSMVISGGSYTGSGPLYVFCEDYATMQAAVSGLDMSDFEVTEYNEHSRYWAIRNVKGLTKLGTPTEPEWGYDHERWAGWDEETQTRIYDTVALPGSISWKTDTPDQAHAMIRVYKECEDVPYHSFSWQFASTELPEWRSIDSFCNSDPESGTYYFTVISEGDYTQYRNSDAAVSGLWTYEKPSAQLDTCTNFVWNWPEVRWDAPADMTYVDGYETEYYFASTADAEPNVVSGGWSRNDPAYASDWIWDELIQENGPGYYYVRVRALSSDITKVCNGEWSEMSPAYNLTDLVEDVGTTLENITATDPDEIRSQVSAIDDEELKSAMLADTGVTEQITELEAKLGVNTNVSVTESAPAIDASKVSVVGAGLNTLETTGEDITLVISEPKQEHVLDAAYDNTVAVSFSMDLDNVADTEDLEVPVKITLPVPANINPEFLVILHYDASGGVKELIMPYLFTEGGQTYVSFVLTSFSDFVMTQYRQTAPGDMNDDGTVNAGDAVALLWHLLGQGEVKSDPDVNKDEALTEADAIYLIWHTLFPELYPL